MRWPSAKNKDSASFTFFSWLELSKGKQQSCPGAAKPPTDRRRTRASSRREELWLQLVPRGQGRCKGPWPHRGSGLGGRTWFPQFSSKDSQNACPGILTVHPKCFHLPWRDGGRPDLTRGWSLENLWFILFSSLHCDFTLYPPIIVVGDDLESIDCEIQSGHAAFSALGLENRSGFLKIAIWIL